MCFFKWTRSAMTCGSWPTPARRAGGVGGEPRQPVRLAAVVGGALALAAGLSSPPLAVIMPGASIFGSDARSPVLAFPDPVHGSSSVRAVTNDRLADRVLDAAPAAKADPPAREPVARAQSDKESSPTPSIPMADRQRTLEQDSTRTGYPAGSVHRDEDARDEETQSPSAATPACTPALMPGHKRCAPSETVSTKGLPASINLPASIELPARIRASMPIFENVRQQQKIRKLHRDADVEAPRHGREQDEKMVGSPEK